MKNGMKNGMNSSLADTSSLMCPRVAEQKLGIEAEGKPGVEEKKGRLGISFLIKARPALGLRIGIPAKNLC